MGDFLRPFGWFHVFAIAFIGCAAMAFITGRTLWMIIALAGGGVGALWAATRSSAGRRR